jgi:hypothetical protein
MLLLSLFAATLVNYFPSYENPEYSNQSGTNVTGANGPVSGEVQVPESSKQTFNIWTTEGTIIIITVCIGVGILAGITVLGSGLKEFSIKLIFYGILYMGIWACLSFAASTYLFNIDLMLYFWVALTLIYVMGVGIQLNTVESGG